jgi:hypothetical protein
MPIVGSWKLGLGVGVGLATIAALCVALGVEVTFTWMLWGALIGAGTVALALLFAIVLALFILK